MATGVAWRENLNIPFFFAEVQSDIVLAWILGSPILDFCMLFNQLFFFLLHIEVERLSLGDRFVPLLSFSIL